MDSIYDIFIIGGGINGAGIARDFAGRGLKSKSNKGCKFSDMLDWNSAHASSRETSKNDSTFGDFKLWNNLHI